MSVRNPVEPTLVAPLLFDKAFNLIGTALQTELSWLTNNYGRAERIPTADTLGRIIHEPLVFVGSTDRPNEYLNMMPDKSLGNHVFFYLHEGQDIQDSLNGIEDTLATFSLVFWWDYRIVYTADHLTRSISNVLDEIYTAIGTISYPSFDISRQFLEAEGIYQHFNYQGNRGQKINQQMQDQFMMRPFGGARLEGNIKIKRGC